MTVTVTASNGAELVVWREHNTYFARRADEASEPQICLAVDLFEVIAELAELDLERQDQAAEALALANDAQSRTRPSDLADEDDEGDGDRSVAADDRRDAS
jgi:hypothetical protein